MTLPMGGGGNSTRNANVVVQADVTGYNQNMQAAAQQTNVLSAAVDKLESKLDGITKRAGRKLIQFSAGDFAALGGATATAANFERQLGTLRATTDLSNQSFKDLKGGIESAFTKFPVARSEVVQLTTAISNMGVVGAKNIGDLTQTFIKLGAATGENTTSLAQGLIQLSRQMGNTNTQQIGNFANALLTVSKNAGVSATSVLSFANNIAPMARAAGIGEAAILGISTAFSKAGADGFVGANAFNKIIGDINQDIATGSPDLAKYANLIGLTTSQFKNADKGKAFVDIIQAISKGGPDAINTLNRLGIDGVRAQSALQALAQSGDLQAQVNKAVGASDNQGNLNKGAKDAMSGLSDELAKLRNNFTQFGTEIGTTFLTPLEKAVGMMNTLFGVMNAIMKPFAPLIAGFAAIAGSLGAIGGVGLLAAGVITKVALARTLAFSTPVRALREGIAVGRNPAATNETAERAAAGTLRPYQQRIFQAGAGIGSFFGGRSASGEEGGIGQRIRNGMIAAPFRAVNALTVTGQTRFLQQSQLNDYERTPVVGSVRNVGQAAGAIARNPIQAFRGARAASDETSAFAKTVSGARGSVDAMRAAAVASAARINQSAIANVEGAKATQVLARESGALAAAFGKLALQTATTGASQVGQGAAYVGRKALGGVGGLLGALGPIGIASIGIPLALGGISAIKGESRRTNITDDSFLNPIKKYDDQLGIATTNLASFSAAVGDAATKQKNLNGVTATSNIKDVARVSQTDVQAAQGQKNSDTTLAALAKSRGGLNNVGALTQLAASYNMTDPREVQLFKQNALAAGYKPDDVQKALTSASGATSNPKGINNFSQIAGAVQNTEGRNTGIGRFLNNGVAVTNPSKSGAALRESALTQIGTQYNTDQQYGTGFAAQRRLANESSYFGSYASTFSGSVQGGKDNAEKVKRKELANALAETFSGGDKSAADKYLKALDQVNFSGLNDTQRQQAILNVLKTTSTGQNALSGVATTDVSKFQSTLNSLYGTGATSQTRQNIQKSSASGAFALRSNTVQAAVNAPADTNLQYTALKDLAANAVATGKGFSGATEQLDKLKSAIQDTTDPLYQLASAAEQYNQRQQSYITPTLSRAGQAQVLNQNLAAAQKSTAPDAQTQLQGAQDAYQQGKEANRQYLISMYQQAQQYGVQMERTYADQYQSVQRTTDDFHTSMLHNQQDFQKSTARNTEDFNLSMQRQAEDAAKNIYNPYAQVQSVYTSDAGSLVLNLEDQNRRIAQQMTQLAQARKMGLSQGSIDELDLANPNNGQQLNSLIDGLTNNPQLIAQINSSVSKRVKATASLTQNTFSETYNRTVADFQKAQKRAEDDYNLAVGRANQAQSLAMNRIASDFQKMINRSAEDLKTAMTEISGSFEALFPKTLGMVNKYIGKYAPDAAKLISQQLDALNAQYPGLGLKGAVAQTPADTKLNQSQLNAKYGWGGHASGGVSTQQHLAMVSEKNKAEAIIPLDQRGQQFMAGMYYSVGKAVAQQMSASSGYKLYGQATQGSSTYHIDSSTNFTGDIMVQADDPKKMLAELQAQQRVARLSRPPRATAANAA